MKPAEHIAIIQEQLRLLQDEGHIEGKPSCWHFHVQATQVIESLRTAFITENSMKEKSNEPK